MTADTVAIMEARSVTVTATTEPTGSGRKWSGPHCTNAQHRLALDGQWTCPLTP
ncbi:hypothetical protein SAMN06295998_11738 [Primorskyibacter flagellatus]|uniref:Uncharacterized protein n=1 Tax=Primorskyibacter flagellatus TaxID=1387277 RepID=A0A1W2DRI9_9RHOB|nr:hypothetical protein SAMN06295998_11738 [Primorskyibacter flagellatus]